MSKKRWWWLGVGRVWPAVSKVPREAHFMIPVAQVVFSAIGFVRRTSLCTDVVQIRITAARGQPSLHRGTSQPEGPGPSGRGVRAASFTSWEKGSWSVG